MLQFQDSRPEIHRYFHASLGAPQGPWGLLGKYWMGVINPAADCDEASRRTVWNKKRFKIIIPII
jgi:hypothetical protein